MTFIVFSLTSLHIPTLVATTTPTSPVCPVCGTIKKSGKLSCCSRGGAWFGNCGSAGNANFGHTWHEGIRACERRRFQAAVVQQLLHGSQPKSNGSLPGVSKNTDSKAVVEAIHMLASTRANTSIPMLKSITVSPSTVTITPVRTSEAHDNGEATPKATTATISIMKSILVSMSIEKSIIAPVNGTATPPATLTINKSMRASYTSASTPVTARECGELMHIITHVSMTFLIVCWY